MLKWIEGGLWKRMLHTILQSLPGDEVTCKTELTVSSSSTKIKHQDRLEIWKDHKYSFPIQIRYNLRNVG